MVLARRIVRGVEAVGASCAGIFEKKENAKLSK